MKIAHYRKKLMIVTVIALAACTPLIEVDVEPTFEVLATISASTLEIEETITVTQPSIPTVTLAPTGTPEPFAATRNIQILCLQVDETGDRIYTIEEDMDEYIQRILTELGIEIVNLGMQCDATLEVNLTNTALGKEYQHKDGIGVSFCYTGAEVKGQTSLIMLNGDEQTHPISKDSPTLSGTIFSCPTKVHQAPFEEILPSAVIDTLTSFWGTPVLIQASMDRSSDLRIAREFAIRRLGQAGPQEGVIEALIEALGFVDRTTVSFKIRAAAAHALGAIEPPAEEAVPALIQALTDTNEQVQWSAASALGKIGPVDGVMHALAEALAVEKCILRDVTARVLGGFGQIAEVAVPALILIVASEEICAPMQGSSVPAAVEALTAITGEDFGLDTNAWQDWWESQH